tara:strand:+ start:238 stop:378 length:141 start_codon:yes stop_codon:yes gene_type:complete
MEHIVNVIADDYKLKEHAEKVKAYEEKVKDYEQKVKDYEKKYLKTT